MLTWRNQLLQSDFTAFIEKTLSTVDPGARYLPSWHIELIAEYLQAVEKSEITRLLINMPPRSLKSVCVSVAWPAWLLGHNPESRIIAASYASALSIKHSLDCRLVLTSAWYKKIFPDVVLVRGQTEKHKFVTTKRGFRLASSVGGGITGEGGNFLLIDDPLNPSQALNNRAREKANHWFDHTFSSRLDHKKMGRIVLVMQRLHQHDLSGYLLAKGGWQHLCLPAVAAETVMHDFGAVCKTRYEEEILHAAREDKELIGRAKTELGSRAFAAQYQQCPHIENGSMIRSWWFPRYKNAPVVLGHRVQSWDTAIKSGAQHDASVCLTFGEYEGQSYLLDAEVMRLEYPDLKKALYMLAEKWKPVAILIEDKASGQQLLQDARREVNLPLIAIKPKHDKVTRFAAVSAMCEAGRVSLPEQASWLADFESELFSFPDGIHDDQVDALSQYLDWLRASPSNRLRIRSI